MSRPLSKPDCDVTQRHAPARFVSLLSLIKLNYISVASFTSNFIIYHVSFEFLYENIINYCMFSHFYAAGFADESNGELSKKKII